MNARTRNLFLALVLAVCLVAGVLVASHLQARQVQTAEASAVDGYAQYTWYNNGITTTANGTGKFTGDYGRFECYQILDVTLSNAVTTTFQSSPDNTNWAAIPAWQFSSNVLAASDGLAGVEADGVTFGITVLEGLYTRPVFTLASANPVTVTMKCVGKDRPGYDLDQEAGALEMTD